MCQRSSTACTLDQHQDDRLLTWVARGGQGRALESLHGDAEATDSELP
jgi:hypothetical protein